MKAFFISLLMLFCLVGWWQWQQTSSEKLMDAWRDARFLNPEVTKGTIEQRLNIRAQRPTTTEVHHFLDHHPALHDLPLPPARGRRPRAD